MWGASKVNVRAGCGNSFYVEGGAEEGKSIGGFWGETTKTSQGGHSTRRARQNKEFFLSPHQGQSHETDSFSRQRKGPSPHTAYNNFWNVQPPEAGQPRGDSVDHFNRGLSMALGRGHQMNFHVQRHCIPAHRLLWGRGGGRIPAYVSLLGDSQKDLAGCSW